MVRSRQRRTRVGRKWSWRLIHLWSWRGLQILKSSRLGSHLSRSPGRNDNINNIFKSQMILKSNSILTMHYFRYFWNQVVEDGYEFFAKRQLVTLFSAPNYCGEFDNAGGMMSVDETLMCSFQVKILNIKIGITGAELFVSRNTVSALVYVFFLLL